MAPKPKAAAMKAVPRAKKDLKKAFGELHAHSSFVASFTSRWKDLEDHLSFIERSIEERLRQLESGEPEGLASSSVATSLQSEKDKPAASAAAAAAAAEVEPRPELKSLCVNMDGRGLLAFIRENRKDLSDICEELKPAIRAAPDPATLVLDAMDGFYPAKRSREDTFDGGLHANRKSCIFLLERLHMISPEIKPAVRERAKKLAAEWKVKVTPDAGQNLEAVAFLQLLASYGIASDFDEDELLDILVSISKRKEAVGLCRSLDLHGRMADAVQKLSSTGKQLDAVKFICAFDLVEKISPAPFLRLYIKESKKVAKDMRKTGSAKSKNAAISREIDQIRAVIRIIEEYKLESQYSPEILQKRLTRLQQWKAEKKRLAGSNAATNAKMQYQKWQANRWPRPSTATATATAATVVAAQPPLALSQTQPEYPLTVGAPYVASTSYDLTGGIHPYDGTTIYKGNLLDLGPKRSASGSLSYSDPRSGSGLYDWSGAYGSYSLSGGLPPQYNSSLYRQSFSIAPSSADIQQQVPRSFGI